MSAGDPRDLGAARLERALVDLEGFKAGGLTRRIAGIERQLAGSTGLDVDMIHDFVDISFGPQDPSLFELPAGASPVPRT